MDGHQPQEELILQPLGPPLRAAAPGCVVITGWREVPGEHARVFLAVQVRDAGQ